MNGFSVQMIFSPQNCALDYLGRTLTEDRRRLAESALKGIRLRLGTRTGGHLLFVGPRGSGKTHLLTYVWKKLKAEFPDPAPPKVIRFSEEERGLTDMFDFLRACLKGAGVPDDALRERLTGRTPVELREQEVEYFREVTDGAQTLLVIENLDDLFRRLDRDALHALRAFLQSNPFVSTLASATALFEGSSSPDHPFYGFFAILPLAPLDVEGARAYLQRLAEARGDRGLSQALASSMGKARVRAVHDLTGGNHRLLAMLSQFLTAKGLDELVPPFIRMVDRELTPYYQQRLDRLSPQQHKIVETIAGNPGGGPLPVGRVADRAFLTSQVVSRQLHDLLHAGFVRRVPLGRESYYELNEPLLRLILDMKKGRDRPLPLVVDLLRAWYSADELRRRQTGAGPLAALYCHAAIEEQTKETAGHEAASRSSTAATQQKTRAGHLLEEGISFGQEGSHEEALARFETAIEEDPDDSRAWYNRAVALSFLGRVDEALAAYDGVVKRFGDSDRPEILDQVAGALVNKGVALGQAGRVDELVRFLPPAWAAVRKVAGMAALLVSALLEGLHSRPDRLRCVLPQLQSDRPAVAHGVAAWVLRSVPFPEDSARGLEQTEGALREFLADLPEAELPLQMLSCARRDALGDRKALMDLPLEVRRLIENAKERKSEDSAENA